MGTNKVLVLYYHRVNSLEHDYNLLCVSPTKFRQQMIYLKNNYRIERFENDWSSLDEDAVVITFDDGYLDNVQYALPILEELEVPATIFVSTCGMKQDREAWWDELEQLLLVGDDFPSSFNLEDREFGCQWKTNTWELRKNCYQSIHYLIKNYIDIDTRENWLNQLWNWKGMKRRNSKDHLLVSAADCQKLAESPVISIGAHTVWHPSLAKLDVKLQEQEIKNSICDLSELLQKPITLFSYPFGQPGVDFNECTIELCRCLGIQKAASTEPALWTNATDLYKIPRQIVRDWNLFEFEERIKGYWRE